MTIELPGDFLVAKKLCVEKVQTAPMNEGRAFAGDRLELPVDRITKAKLAKTQKIELAFGEAIGAAGDLFNGVGKSSPKLINCAVRIIESRKKPWTSSLAKVTEKFRS